MNFVWAVEIAKEHRGELGRLRLLPGVEIGETTSSYWLRGTQPIDEASGMLLAIPHAKLFHLNADGTLLPWGKRLSSGRLPSTPFGPLERMLQPTLPVAAYPRGQVARVPITLVRSDEERPATIVLTTLKEWLDFATTAPEVRLHVLSFATSSDGRTLVRGEPLPSLPGRRYWEHNGVAIPLGWTCSPAQAAAVLFDVVQAERDDVVLLHDDGSFETIASDHFVRASRSAVRATRNVGDSDES
ncbi:MAG: hypothetical protein R3C01_12695 [Planctomycetaceae bacterium]